jgi:DNA-directed RNA polymerase specialized sigma24 family protein
MEIEKVERIVGFYKSLDAEGISFLQSLSTQTGMNLSAQTGMQRKSKYNAAKCQKAYKLHYVSGFSIKEVGKMLGISGGKANYLIRLAEGKKATRKKRGRHSRYNKYTPEQIRKATELHNQSVSNREISKITGINVGTLYTGHIWKKMVEQSNALP